MAGIEAATGPFPGVLRLRHDAMATTFEILLPPSDPRYAGQAAAAAFEELDRLERELSRHIATSDIARIRQRAAARPVRVGEDAFACLRLGARLREETDGAFDAAIGSFLDPPRRAGRAEAQDRAGPRAGSGRIVLDPSSHTVSCPGGPAVIDLGGIGKGYAIDVMADLLRAWGIEWALVHGGSSSVRALGAPSGRGGWPLALPHPRRDGETIGRVELREAALGASGLRKGRHIIDPRTGRPVEGERAAWAGAPTAAVADALSTAFMVMGAEEIERFVARHPDVLAVVWTGGDEVRVREGSSPAVSLLRAG